MIYPPFTSCQIGDFLVTALSDGTMSASLDLLMGIKIKNAEVIQHNAGITCPGDIHINCYLIRGRGRTILVDTGTGGHNEAGGQLTANLAALGVSPDDVDTILLTHCHPDHIGGLLNDEGKPVYINAEIHLHALEAEYWWDDEKQKTASERGKYNYNLARRALNAYGQNVHCFTADKITDDIVPVWLPGHTPGHSGFRINSREKSLLIWGDIVHYPYIQSAQPAVSILFDCDPAQAEETRKNILQYVVKEQLIIAGMHLHSAGFASVVNVEDGYRISYLE